MVSGKLTMAKKTILWILVICALTIITQSVSAAPGDILLSESFEGSGEPAGWDLTTGSADYDFATGCYNGSKCLLITQAGVVKYPLNSGDPVLGATCRFWGKTNTTNKFLYNNLNSDLYTGFETDGTFKWYADADRGGNVSYSANSWYLFYIQAANNNAKFLVKSEANVTLNSDTASAYSAHQNRSQFIGATASDFLIDDYLCWEGLIDDEPNDPFIGIDNLYEATVEINQTSAFIQINSANYQTIEIGSINPGTTKQAQVEWSMDLFPINPTPDMNCRILLNGNKIAEGNRTGSGSGVWGRMSINSENVTLLPTINNLSLQCKGSTYRVYDSKGVIHSLTTITGKQTNFSINNISVSSTTSDIKLLEEFSFVTSNYILQSNSGRSLLIDGYAEIAFNSTNNVTLQFEINNTNCSQIIRYGSNSNIGNVGITCLVNGIQRNENHTIKLYGGGGREHNRNFFC